MFFVQNQGTNSLAVSDSELTESICRMMHFYQGGVSWSELREMRVDDYIVILSTAQKINKEQEKASNG